MDRVLRWASPAANVLLYACEEHLPKMEEVLHEYQGKPQHPFLQEVINDMKMEIAIRERDAQKRAMPRPQKKSVQPRTADTTATAACGTFQHWCPHVAAHHAVRRRDRGGHVVRGAAREKVKRAPWPVPQSALFQQAGQKDKSKDKKNKPPRLGG